jgi:uncharacterized protein (UPF0264 family)
MRLLVSVRDDWEAECALEAGADLIDLKDPNAGALGALDPNLIGAILGTVAGRQPTSATTGDLPPDPALLCAAAQRIAASGVDYVKVGLWPGEGRTEAILRLGAALAGRTRLVGVILADVDLDLGLVPVMADAGFAGAMLDCARKGPSLVERLGPATLGQFVALCHFHGLLAGLAGSLRTADIPQLAGLGADVLGFRGGLCQGFDRTRPLDPDAVCEAVTALAATRHAGASAMHAAL